MLQIVVPSADLFDENTNSFIQTNETVLKLEHSLLSISKWESKWQKPFLSSKAGEKRTPYEMLDYIKCMTLNTNVNDDIYLALSTDNIKEINKYITAPMTATTIYSRKPNPIDKETITSELLYYYMIVYNVPFECEKWHLNRLITLLRVCAVKNNTKKMSKSELASHNRALNAARRKRLGTRG